MHVFLDESGTDKQHGKSSVALVCVEIKHVGKLESSILELERRLEIPPFHWSRSAWPVREKFIRSIANENFSLRVAIIKNPFNASYVYESIVGRLLYKSNIQSLVIDGKKNRFYERRLKKALRGNGVSLKKLRTANDISSPVLRLADAVAGLVRYRAEFPENEKVTDLYAKISKKITIFIED
jgi:hypothetical protein